MIYIKDFTTKLLGGKLDKLSRPFLYTKTVQRTVTVDNGDGTTSDVVENVVECVVDHELTFNEIYPDAITVSTSAALASGISKSYITFDSDITLTLVLNPGVSGSTIIDLNGHTLSLDNAYFVIGAISNKTHTIFKNGTIKVLSYDKYKMVFPSVKQKLSLENVSVDLTDVPDEWLVALSDAYANNKVVNIKDCTISGKTCPIGINGTKSGNVLNISNTVFDCPESVHVMYLGGNVSPTYGANTINVTGCTINAKGGIESKHNNLTVTGTTFNLTGTQSYVPKSGASCSEGYAIACTTNGSEPQSKGKLTLKGNTYNMPEGTEYSVLVVGDATSCKPSFSTTPTSASYDSAVVRYQDVNVD